MMDNVSVRNRTRDLLYTKHECWPVFQDKKRISEQAKVHEQKNKTTTSITKFLGNVTVA
jgi:hypothetical protein